jgi:hypothetical protein
MWRHAVLGRLVRGVAHFAAVSIERERFSHRLLPREMRESKRMMGRGGAAIATASDHAQSVRAGRA